MQDLEEGGDGIAGHLSNLCLLNQRLVEECCSVLLLLACAVTAILITAVLNGGHTGDVEAHLDELVPTSSSLLALSACAA